MSKRREVISTDDARDIIGCTSKGSAREFAEKYGLLFAFEPKKHGRGHVCFFFKDEVVKRKKELQEIEETNKRQSRASNTFSSDEKEFVFSRLKLLTIFYETAHNDFGFIESRLDKIEKCLAELGWEKEE